MLSTSPGDNINNFYRTIFPGVTATPNFHMLEEHVLPFLEKWRVGGGFHGEQAAEAINQGFIELRHPTHAIIHDPLK